MMDIGHKIGKPDWRHCCILQVKNTNTIYAQISNTEAAKNMPRVLICILGRPKKLLNNFLFAYEWSGFCGSVFP
jgi:hypothetical protein